MADGRKGMVFEMKKKKKNTKKYDILRFVLK